MTFDVVLIIRP